MLVGDEARIQRHAQQIPEPKLITIELDCPQN